jgi:hypothetical protein
MFPNLYSPLTLFSEACKQILFSVTLFACYVLALLKRFIFCTTTIIFVWNTTFSQYTNFHHYYIISIIIT